MRGARRHPRRWPVTSGFALMLALTLLGGCARQAMDSQGRAIQQQLDRMEANLAPLLTHEAMTVRRDGEQLRITVPDGVDQHAVPRLIDQRLQHPTLYEGYEWHLTTPPGATRIDIFRH